MLKAVLFVLCSLALASRVVEDHELDNYTFEQYIRDFGKQHYSLIDYQIHAKIFYQNLAEIKRHNSENSMFKKGVNKFTDMTESEFKTYLGYNIKMGSQADGPCDQQFRSPVSVEALPDSVDWRSASPPVLSPVKDQGSCGSCWAFATAETVESSLAIATKMAPPVLSPQNVVSCTPNPDHCGGTGGCNGATAELGFTYVKNSGISTEADWPYKAITGTCDTASHTPNVTVAGCVKLAENNYNDLLTAVATIGPIAVSVDASKWSSYSKGIYDACDKQTNYDIDHAVQLVGYGTENGVDYWIVRNSWGPNWGENGYIRLLRHSDGSSNWCKTDLTPSDGSGCDGGPPTVTVCGECGIWYDSSYPYGAKYL